MQFDGCSYMQESSSSIVLCLGNAFPVHICYPLVGDCACLTYSCRIGSYYCLPYFIVLPCTDQCAVFFVVNVGAAWIV